MHTVKIIDGHIFLDDKQLSGVAEYQMKSSTTDRGNVEELFIRLRVKIGRIDSE